MRLRVCVLFSLQSVMYPCEQFLFQGIGQLGGNNILGFLQGPFDQRKQFYISRIRVKSGGTPVTQVLKVVPNPALPPDTAEYDAIIHTNSGEAAISLNGRQTSLVPPETSTVIALSGDIYDGSSVSTATIPFAEFPALSYA